MTNNLIFYDLGQLDEFYSLYDVYLRFRELLNMARYADDKALSENNAREFDELCVTFLEAFTIQFRKYRKCLSSKAAVGE